MKKKKESTSRRWGYDDDKIDEKLSNFEADDVRARTEEEVSKSDWGEDDDAVAFPEKGEGASAAGDGGTAEPAGYAKDPASEWCKDDDGDNDTFADLS